VGSLIGGEVYMKLLMPAFMSGPLVPEAFHPVVPNWFVSEADECPRGLKLLFRRCSHVHESARNGQNCHFIQSPQSLSSPAPSPQLPLKKSLRSFVSGFAAAPKSGSTRKISCNVFNVELWS
jgi:hypothetical protein